MPVRVVTVVVRVAVVVVMVVSCGHGSLGAVAPAIQHGPGAPPKEAPQPAKPRSRRSRACALHYVITYAPHALSLRQLQYIVAVAEQRNFRRAAALCRVSQPSLSAQVAQAEGALGVQLFERGQRGVLLTGAGQEIVARARKVLLEADDLVANAARLADPLGGTLRVGVIPTISPYLLPELVPALHREHPRLEVLWIEDKTSALAQRLADGTLDAALLALEADIGDVQRETIGKDPFVLATPTGHPLARGRGPVRLDELQGASVLLLDDGHCLRDQALSVCQRAKARELDFRATSLATLVQMVSANAGVTLLPTMAVAAETRRARLVIRSLQPAPSRTIALAWRRGAAREPAIHAVAGTMRSVYPA